MVFTTKAKQIALKVPLLSLPLVPTAKWEPLSPSVPYAAGLRPCVVQPSSTGSVEPVLLRGKDLNPRPPGYEPGELPNCSTALCATPRSSLSFSARFLERWSLTGIRTQVTLYVG